MEFLVSLSSFFISLVVSLLLFFLIFVLFLINLWRFDLRTLYGLILEWHLTRVQSENLFV